MTIRIKDMNSNGLKNEVKYLNTFSNYFYKNNLTLLLTDTAGRRDVLHQRLTSKTAFIRFVANDLHATDYKRMDEWITRLKNWIDNGLEEIYFSYTPLLMN